MSSTGSVFDTHASRAVASVILLVAAGVFACSGSDGGPSGPGPDPDPDPQTGFIQVSTTTIGDEFDPDGFTTTLDGSVDRSIGLNGITTFSNVATGSHDVTLSGLAGNCSVNGDNPIDVTVSAGATAQSAFDVVCVATTGSLEISTSTTNNFDPDGYLVFVAGDSVGPVAVNGTETFEKLPAGPQPVELREIAPNCSVDGDNAATVTIPAGGSVTKTFTITCISPPDGRIIFQESHDWVGTWVSVMNADGSGRLQLREIGGYAWRQAAWSPDGSKVAVTLLNQSTDGNPDIYVMNKDASGLTQLTTGLSDDMHPAWSPDGAWIVFVRRYESGYASDSDLWVVKADGTEPPLKLTINSGTADSYPAWSPDGFKIAYSHSSVPGKMTSQHQIRVMNSDGKGVLALTGPHPICSEGSNQGYPAWVDSGPDWSPDGTKIAFSRRYRCEPEDTENDRDILVMSAVGADVVNLTNGPATEGSPSWSPDGSRIVFEIGNGIAVMNADGTGQKVIAEGGDEFSFYRPDWGP